MISNPWMIVGLLLAAIALGGTCYFKGKAVGEREERAVWAELQLQQSIAASRQLQEAQAKARGAEQRFAALVAKVDKDYQEKRHANQARRDMDNRAARDGVIGLRYPQPGADGARGIGCATPSPASSGDGAPTTELPRALAADLLDLANDADAVVEQLTSCQAVVLADRSDRVGN